jgi:hypothetical protein
MFENFRNFLVHRRELREVESPGERDLDDLGMLRDRLRRFIHLPADSALQLEKMAALLGLDRAALRRDRLLYLDRLEACGACRDRCACAKVLARGERLSPAEVPFCPNAAGLAVEAGG